MNTSNNVINLEDYRKSNEMEEDYLKFLSHVNKFMKVPTTIPETVRAFYFTLRYLEGTINAFSILSIIKYMPEEQITEVKNMVINYMSSLIDDLKKY